MPKRRQFVIVNPQTADTIGRRIALSEISHPIVVTAWQTWSNEKSGQIFPSRVTMTPKRMAPFLKNVMLIAVIDGGADYEIRVVGDAVRAAFGQNFSGMRLADLNNLQSGFGDVIARVCRFVLNTGLPLAVQGTLTRADFDADLQQGIFLPLGVNADVDHILYVAGYTRKSWAANRTAVNKAGR